MTSSNIPSSSANQDDPWEQLAEDLFGLEYGKEHAAHEPAPPAVEPVSTPAPESHAAARALLKKDEPEPSAVADEPPRYASEAAAEVKSTFAEPVEEVDDSDVPVADTAPEPAAREPVSPQDSYWDALANWNWDESEGSGGKPRPEPRRADQRRPDQGRSGPGRSGGGPPPRGGSRGRDEGRGRRGGERQAAAEPPAPASAPTPASPSRAARQPDAPASDEFGSGLVGETPGFSAPAETVAADRSPNYETRDEVPPFTGIEPGAGSESAPERGVARSGKRPGERGPGASEEGEFPRKRRRRRRRRGGRGGEGAPEGGAPAASPAVPGEDWDDSAGPEADLPDDEAELVIEEEGSPPVTEPVGDRPAPDSRGRHHGRRHEEPSRGAVSNRIEQPFDADDNDEPQEMILAGGGAGEPELDSDGDDEGDDGDESGEEQAVSYENIPTWEEAISYLLHPNQVQVEPGASSGGSKPPRGAPPADQHRQTRHIGHRKPRR